MDYRECPDCDGWGEVTLERDTFGPSGHGNRNERQECETCNGRGEVPEGDDSED
jgi:DnaJ-class molecular chaperone